MKESRTPKFPAQASKVYTYKASCVLVHEHGGITDDFIKRLDHILRDQIVRETLAQIQRLVLRRQSIELHPEKSLKCESRVG